MKPPAVEVSGSVSNLTKTERNEKTKMSCFWCTVNTNQQYKENDEHLKSDAEFFEDTLKEMFQNLPQILRVQDPWNNTNILDVKVDYVVERGKKHQLHAHFIIKVRHKTHIQVDTNKLKTWFRDRLGVNVYVNIKYLRNVSSENFLLDYIDKQK